MLAFRQFARYRGFWSCHWIAFCHPVGTFRAQYCGWSIARLFCSVLFSLALLLLYLVSRELSRP